MVQGDIEGGAYASGGAAAGCGGCGAVCFEPEDIQTKERWVYKGAGMGSYAQVGNMEMVGAGRGDFEKDKYAVASGSRVRFACIGMVCLSFLGLVGLTVWWLQMPQPKRDVPMPSIPLPRPEQVVIHDKYYTKVKNVRVPHTVPVPIPPPPRKVITHHVTVHTQAFDCSEGVNNWKSTWSGMHQRYCCYKEHVACSTKITYRPHYHTITRVKQHMIHVPMPIPAPPPQVINHVVNVPIHDPPQIIKVPVPGRPNVVPKYMHVKQYVPVPEPTPPKYHSVPVPFKVKDPGQVIKVPVPLAPKTLVKNKVIYKTRHVKVRHIYDCHAGYSNWNAGWSSAKKSWCCSHESRGCPGDHSGHLTKTYVTHVTQHMGPSYMSHHYHTYDDEAPVVVQHVHHYHTVSHADMDGGFDGGNTVTHVVHHYPGDADVPEMDSGKTETHVVHHYADYGDSSEGSEASEGVSFGGGSFHHVSGGGSFSSHHMSGGGSFSSHHVSGGGSFSGGSFSSGGSHSFHSSGSFHHVSGSGSFSHSSDH